MGKAKKDTVPGDQSIEKKSKKRKSTDAVTAPEPMETAEAEPELDGETERKAVLSPIAVPLADAKLKKRTLKLVKKAALGKQLKRGVKEVVKALRKGTTG